MTRVNDTVISAAEAPAGDALTLHCIAESNYAAWREAQAPAARQWLERAAFTPERGRYLLLPDATGRAQAVAVGCGSGMADIQSVFWLAAGLADRVPAGLYRLAEPQGGHDLAFVLGWLQGGYRFQRFKTGAVPPSRAQLLAPAGVDLAYARAATRAAQLARDLVNTPANELGPAELHAAAQQVASAHGGSVTVIEGTALARGYPLVAAVGAGSPRAPRLIDMRFARAGAPRVTLVGKGVCFDSGGLDIKPAAGMLLMKKDMGGAAMALGTAQLLREMAVKVDLRVLIPAVENSVDGAAFRPGDVWPSRKGLTVEIGNTDAEGRLVLADALAAAGEDSPDLIVDFATLTGAARIALGAELPAAYSGDASLLAQLAQCGAALGDPVWPMPLWDGYEDELASRVADLNNAPSSGLGGSVTAALFLRRFVSQPQRWLHLDLYAWNGKDRPGRPLGAEAQCLRAVTALLQQRYA